MNVSPSALLAHARSEEGRKQLRYVGVSVVFVPLGQVFVQIFGSFMTFTAATLLTSAILTLPNFFANKHFVWRVDSKDNLRTQVLVFWVAAMLGVTFATVLTYLAEQLTIESNLLRRLVIFGAQVLGFGTVWVIRYLILDRWLFKITHDGEEPTPDDLDEMHGDIPV
jgi:MFS family permease